MVLPNTRNALFLVLYLFILQERCHSFLTLLAFSHRTRHLSYVRESPENLAEDMRKQAEKLRQEVASFQQKKEANAEAERKSLEKVQEEKQAIRERYSAMLPILKGDGQTLEERIDFPPRQPDGTSYIKTCEASLPLGLILGESEDIPGLTVVDEVVEGSNGQKAGVRVGDIVRACTACQTMMKAPTWQILAGGIGMPETQRMMFNIDGRPFEEVMDAISSNRMDPEGRPVILVVERLED